jgi:hypothetical protein
MNFTVKILFGARDFSHQMNEVVSETEPLGSFADPKDGARIFKNRHLIFGTLRELRNPQGFCNR